MAGPHPPFWPGFDSTAIGCDDFNGGGINEPWYVDLPPDEIPPLVGMTQDGFWDKRACCRISHERLKTVVPRERARTKVKECC
jgi:hypothetical protein